MKLLSMFMLLMAINLGLLLFTLGAGKEMGGNNALLGSNGAQADLNMINPDGTYTPVDSSKYTSDDLIRVFMDPTAGNNSRIVLYVIGFALLIGGLGFVPFINRSDLSVLAGPFIILVGIAAPTIVGLWSFINGQTSGYFCEVTEACLVSNVLGIIISGTLMVAWLFACLEWWTGRPSS